MRGAQEAGVDLLLLLVDVVVFGMHFGHVYTSGTELFLGGQWGGGRERREGGGGRGGKEGEERKGGRDVEEGGRGGRD